MKTKALAIVQARMASTRLPGKVLADIEGRPLLVREIERAKRAQTLQELVVATTIEAGDDPIAQLCMEHGYACCRGSVLDVLDRFYQAAVLHGAEIVVRLTGDCPLIDPGLIDQAVAALVESDPPVDFVANRLPNEKTYPVGTDVEVCTFAALERTWVEATEAHQREHVMPYLYEDPNRFRTLLLQSDTDYSHYRWTVDTQDDLELVRQIFARFDGRNDFDWHEVLELLKDRPDLLALNADVDHRSQFDLDPGWSDA